MVKLFPLLIACFLTGCVSLIPKTKADVRLMSLTALETEKFSTPAPLTVSVDVPVAAADLSGSDILEVHEASNGVTEITTYKKARWSDPLAKILQDKILILLEEHQVFKSIHRPEEGVVADLILQTAVEKFYIVKTAKERRAEIHLSLKLLDPSTGKVIAYKVFQTSEKTAEVRLQAYVHALNQAYLQAQREILEWLKTAPKKAH